MIVYVDAAKNSVTRTINSYGKQASFDNGGFRIGILIEQTGEEIRAYNTKVTDSFAAETFGLLKAVEAAADRVSIGEKIVIRHDGGTTEETKSKQASKYVWVMKKVIAERGLDVEFEHVPGTENKADRVSRTEAVRIEPEAAKPSAEAKAKAEADHAEFTARMKIEGDARKFKEKAIKQVMKSAGIVGEVQGWKTVTATRAKKFIAEHDLGDVLPDLKEAQELIRTSRFHLPRQTV